MIPKIHELSRRQIADVLNELTPHARPISSAAHLKGRETQLNEIEQAIYAAGRHVFIHGERGVGKTSLAKTAGIAAAGATGVFKQIGCSTDAKFQQLIRQVLEVFKPEVLETVTKDFGWSLSYVLGFEAKRSTTTSAISEFTASQASNILATLDEKSAMQTKIILIDETDRIVGEETKRQLAELVKLLGDRGARLTLIFTGVGEDLHSILGHHPSSFRQLAQIDLARLGFQPALDIIDDVLDRFDLDWEVEPVRTIRFRIASIANGFPYYVHLLMEKLVYAVYADKTAKTLEARHLRQAVQDAVREAAEEIRKPYDKATRGRSRDFKHIVWAMADSWELERDTASVFRSYLNIVAQIGEEPAPQAKVTRSLSTLKGAPFGSILASGYRKGQYRFSENIIRGYVRLCAEAEAVDLDDAAPYEPPSITARGREKRYVDPRRIGGRPRGFER